jgi:hypothetical protein
MTVCSADHFQSYIPLYIAALRTWSKDSIVIYLKGKLNSKVKTALESIDDLYIIKEGCFGNYPDLKSTTNCLRFIVNTGELFQYTIITDIDMLLFQDPWNWNVNQITPENPFAGHHGPYHKPRRPEVCPSWTGDFERVAGGMFCVTTEWYRRSETAQDKYDALLQSGEWGWFRESDEVMLARIIKESGMQVPQSKVLPTELRGVHLGDFKESMNHRWKDPIKMQRILTPRNCTAYRTLSVTSEWQSIVSILHDDKLNGILDNINTYLESRGL